MKVTVVYEDSEKERAINLAKVLNSGLGRLLTGATINPGGNSVSMPNAYPLGVTVQATAKPLERQALPPTTVRQLDFDEEEH